MHSRGSGHHHIAPLPRPTPARKYDILKTLKQAYRARVPLSASRQRRCGPGAAVSRWGQFGETVGAIGPVHGTCRILRQVTVSRDAVTVSTQALLALHPNPMHCAVENAVKYRNNHIYR
jgi:hypothetical protein